MDRRGSIVYASMKHGIDSDANSSGLLHYAACNVGAAVFHMEPNSEQFVIGKA